MAYPSSPYELNRDSVSSGRYLAYHYNITGDSGDPYTYDSYVIDVNQNPTRGHSWSSYPTRYTTGWYHGIAYANSNYGWWLIEPNTFKVTDNITDKYIILNNQNHLIIIFHNSKDNFYLSDNDTISNVA